MPEETADFHNQARGQHKERHGITLKIKDRTISVAYGVEGATLKKFAGRLIVSASPGTDGMCVVYGHRNRAYLRILENVSKGDTITVARPDDTIYVYTVTDTQIFEDTGNLQLPAQNGKTLAIATCYPFRYFGNAPGKCVVTADLPIQP